MTDENCKAASKREESDAGINSSEPMEQREPKGCSHPLGRVATEEGESQREQARTHRVQMMMLDIDGILTRHHADTTEVLAAAQQMAVSAIVQQKFTDLLHANGGGKVERTGIETKAYVERANGSGEATGGDDNGNGGDDNGGNDLEG